RGMRFFDDFKGAEVVSAEQAFTLVATYGLPFEVIAELARDRGQIVDEEGFQREMDRHREISRAVGARYEQRAADLAARAGFRTEFVGYEKIDVLTQIGAYDQVEDGLFLTKLRESPFYPAGGGQVTDEGVIENEEGFRAILREAYRFENDQVLLFEGAGFSKDQRVRAAVPWVVR